MQEVKDVLSAGRDCVVEVTLYRISEPHSFESQSSKDFSIPTADLSDSASSPQSQVSRGQVPISFIGIVQGSATQTSAISAHFQSRSGKSRQECVKLSVCVPVGSLLPTAVVASWGANYDKQQVQTLIERSSKSKRPKRLFADAKYIHELFRDHWGTKSIIKPAVHRTDDSINGKYGSRKTLKCGIYH